MIYFHVQRLSGGFVLTCAVGVVGFIIFSTKMSVVSGIVFFLYIVAIAMYLNILGMWNTLLEELAYMLTGNLQASWQPCTNTAVL